MTQGRDHGGGLDAAAAHWGGARADWIDLSTGINPVPYPVGDVSPAAWTALPDRDANDRLLRAARRFWEVPAEAGIIATPGASALIARLPGLLGAPGRVRIPGPTYNEWAAAFTTGGWRVVDKGSADITVLVLPNNPDGRLAGAVAGIAIYDESFCDVMPGASQVERAGGDVLIVKSFGKFWGLAGLRLGFLIGAPDRVAQMAAALGPWPVSGPALEIGARALEDLDWAASTRARLAADAVRLDALMARHGRLVGGTDLFRLYEVPDAALFQDRLARHRIWSRMFPYSKTWLRLGLPDPGDWPRLEAAL